MQSLRRAALRSVASATRTAAPKAPSSQFGSQFVAKNVIVKQTAVSLTRYFSQTARVADNESGNVESQIQQKASPTETPQKPRADPPHGIWIRGFVFDVTEDHLRELFSKFGTVIDVRIVRDRQGLSKGFGFVYMTSEKEVSEAVAELNGSFWHGRRMTIEKQNSEGPTRRTPPPTAPGVPTRYLYIGNIPYEATDAELNKLFRGLDNLEDVRVAVDRATGFPRGFAHADFTDIESAERAKEKLSQTDIGGRTLRVDYAGNNVKEGKGGNRNQKSQ